MLDPTFDLGNINDITACNLCFNIFPEGQGILHKLAKGDDNIDDKKSQQGFTADQIKAVERTKALFEITERGVELGITAMDPGTPLEIPILEDWYGATAIDYALGAPKQDAYGGIFNIGDGVAARKIAETVNISLASIIF